MKNGNNKHIYFIFFTYRKFLQWCICALTSLLVIKILYDNREIFTKLLEFKPTQVVSILFLFFILFTSSFIPFFLILKKFYQNSISFWQLFPILTVGRMANIFFPQSGTIYKAAAFKSDFNLSYTQYIKIFALFTWLTFLLNLFLAAISILIIMPDLKLFQLSALFIITGFFGIMLIGPIIVYYIFYLFQFDNPLAVKFHKKLKGFFEAMTTYGKDKRLLFQVFFFSLLYFLLTVLLFKLIFEGMNVPIGYEHIALLSIIRKVSNLFFITPGNVGVQELLYGVICESIGIGTAQGIMASVILRVVGYTVILPLGIAFGGVRALKR